MSKVVTRFAPSPTGSLHIGGIRSALFPYALAKQNKGKFILRIEDTDQARYVEGAEEEIEQMLKLYKLDFDEKFKQSERKDIYKKYAEQLVKEDKAYYCFATKEEIQSARESSQKAGEIFRFRSQYRDLSNSDAKKKVENGEEYVIRLKTPLDTKILFEDGLQGKMEFHSNEVDDTVLLKSDGFPTYHLAVVVDDHEMEVTDVFRGVEWLPSVPKHVLIYKAFGWEMPNFYHLPLILDPEGGKLSKRKGAVSAAEFIKEGYLPEAILNFLMLLGWSAPVERKYGESEREIYSLEEFVEIFDTKDLNKSSGVFNREKLLWFNQQYIKDMDTKDLVKRYGEWHTQYSEALELRRLISEKGENYLSSAMELVKERLKMLSEIDDSLKTFYFAPGDVNFVEFKQVKNLDQESINKIIESFRNELEEKESVKSWGHEKWEKYMRNLAEELGLGAGKVFMTLRLALTGSPMTPPLFEIMEVLEKEEVLKRLA